MTVRQIEQRRIEIHIIVDVIADKIAELITPAEGNDGIKYIRMTQGEIHGVITAKTASRSKNISTSRMRLHKWHDFLNDIRIIRIMPVGPLTRRHRRVHPRFIVHTAHGEQHHAPFIDKVLNTSDHAKIFIFIIRTARRRKDNDGLAGMSIDIEFHIFAQRRAKPAEILFFHTIYPDESGALCANVSLTHLVHHKKPRISGAFSSQGPITRVVPKMLPTRNRRGLCAEWRKTRWPCRFRRRF